MRKYFSTSPIFEDPSAKFIRRIPPEEMLGMLKSIKFEDKNKDMILAYISIVDDLILELLMNPNNYKPGFFHFGSILARGGKAIINIFKFLIKNSLQQLSLLKSQFCLVEVPIEIFNSRISENQARKRLKVIKSLIESFVDYIGLVSERGKYLSLIVVMESNTAFQYLSSSPYSGDPSDHKKGNRFASLSESLQLPGLKKKGKLDLDQLLDKKDNDYDQLYIEKGSSHGSIYNESQVAIPTPQFTLEMKRGIPMTYLVLDHTNMSQNSMDFSNKQVTQTDGTFDLFNFTNREDKEHNLNQYIMDMLKASKQE